MRYPKCACIGLLVWLAASCAAQDAQTPKPADDKSAQAPAAAPAPATPPPAPVWSVGGIDFSGFVDGYYDLNFNHPGSGANGLRNFDVKADQFSLNMAKLTLDHGPDPIGFHIDLAFGRAMEIIHAGDSSPNAFHNIEQAYVEWKPAGGKGFQADFGEFVTSAGAEVIETKDNWNYSRSLLFAWAIPYYHFGLRLTQPVGKFTGGFQVVNGWNNIEDNNSGKTIGLVGNYTEKKWAWNNNYYTGPENNGTNQGFRNLYDTTLLLTPSDKFSAYVNYDYMRNKRPGNNTGADHLDGIAFAARGQMTELFALAARLEWMNDASGFSTGVTQKVKEFTLTGEMKLKEGLLTRLEYRHDWSNAPFFDRGNETMVAKSQDTVLIGIVAFFGPKR